MPAVSSRRLDWISPKFVENIPRELDEGVLYISDKHKIAVHKCASGCGEKVVTPLSSAQWRLTEDKGRVSLSPSIGNWNYECKSHYWIRRNRIVWAKPLSPAEIAEVQLQDRVDLENYVRAENARRQVDFDNRSVSPPMERGIWRRFRHWVRQMLK
jgi:hypothetical protein